MYDNQLFYLTTLTNLYIMTNLKKIFRHSGPIKGWERAMGAAALGPRLRGPRFAGSGQNCFMQLVESKCNSRNK